VLLFLTYLVTSNKPQLFTPIFGRFLFVYLLLKKQIVPIYPNRRKTQDRCVTRPRRKTTVGKLVGQCPLKPVLSVLWLCLEAMAQGQSHNFQGPVQMKMWEFKKLGKQIIKSLKR
jgi:hypothetical protein